MLPETQTVDPYLDNEEDYFLDVAPKRNDAWAIPIVKLLKGEGFCDFGRKTMPELDLSDSSENEESASNSTVAKASSQTGEAPGSISSDYDTCSFSECLASEELIACDNAKESSDDGKIDDLSEPAEVQRQSTWDSRPPDYSKSTEVSPQKEAKSEKSSQSERCAIEKNLFVETVPVISEKIYKYITERTLALITLFILLYSRVKVSLKLGFFGIPLMPVDPVRVVISESPDSAIEESTIDNNNGIDDLSEPAEVQRQSTSDDGLPISESPDSAIEESAIGNNNGIDDLSEPAEVQRQSTSDDGPSDYSKSTEAPLQKETKSVKSSQSERCADETNLLVEAAPVIRKVIYKYITERTFALITLFILLYGRVKVSLKLGFFGIPLIPVDPTDGINTSP